MIEGRLRAEFTILGTFSAARVDDRADIEPIAAENLAQPVRGGGQLRERFVVKSARGGGVNSFAPLNPIGDVVRIGHSQ